MPFTKVLCDSWLLQIVYLGLVMFSPATALEAGKFSFTLPLQWRHNDRDGVSNHRRFDCLLNRLFRRRSKKTSQLRVKERVGGAVRFLVVGTIGKWKTTTGSALDGAVLDITKNYYYSNSGLSSTQYEQISVIFGFCHFGWLSVLVNNILAGLWLNCISSVEITLFLLADILLQHRALFRC